MFFLFWFALMFESSFSDKLQCYTFKKEAIPIPTSIILHYFNIQVGTLKTKKKKHRFFSY